MSETRRGSSTARRRILSHELKKLTQAAGLDAVDIDDELEQTRGNTARALRGAWAKPRLPQVNAICDVIHKHAPHLDVGPDSAKRAYLLDLTRQARKKDWWHRYGVKPSPNFSMYMGLEAEAEELVAFESSTFHGLVQTASYARSVIRNGPMELSLDEVEERVQMRLERQNLLTDSADPLRLWLILDEAVLCRIPKDEVDATGTVIKTGRQIMLEQLQHVRDLAALAKVTIQVVPFDAGPHAATSGPFAMMKFADRAEVAGYTENPAGEFVLEETDDTTRLMVALEKLRGVALSPDDSLALLAEYSART
ncbi:DUF5753 domain-containing protein [Spirillospora sp. NPDC127200]